MEGREKQTWRKVWIKEVLGLRKRNIFKPYFPISSYWCDLSQPTTHLHPTCHPITFLPSLMCTEYIKREPMSQSQWPPLFHCSQLLGELGQRLDRGERPPRNWSLHTLVEFQQQSDKINSWSERFPLWQLCTQGSQPCSISLFIRVYKHPPEEHIQWAQLETERRGRVQHHDKLCSLSTATPTSTGLLSASTQHLEQHM